MSKLRFTTAGESHGQALVAILEGLPAGLRIDVGGIDQELARRQWGYGRGGRMKIERDHAEILSGVRHGLTLGSPIALIIQNKDWANWTDVMSAEPRDVPEEKSRRVKRPRPGHADLVGTMKFGFDDARRALERASARETAARVAVGALCRTLLNEFGIQVCGHVVEIGGVAIRTRPERWDDIPSLAEASELRCVDAGAEGEMRAAIDDARQRGDTLGGVFEVIALGVPPGLGSYVHWDRKLDGRLAQAVMSIHAVKGVEVGPGFEMARTPGSRAHDEIFWTRGRGFFRETNRAGGTEGGVTTCAPAVVRGAMKPLSTLMSPLRSVDIKTKEAITGAVVRSDVCAVPAAGVVGESMVCFVLADALLEKFGSDSLADIKLAYEAYLRRIKEM